MRYLSKQTKTHLFSATASLLCLASANFADSTVLINQGTNGELPMCSDSDFCYSIMPSISGDGRYVTFTSTVRNLVPGQQPASPLPQIFLRDRGTCTLIRISETSSGVPGNFPSNESVFSADGQFIVFLSGATNLVSASGQNMNVRQVLLYDRVASGIELISASSLGVAGNGSCGAVSISADGRYVCFQSDANNLVTDDTNNQPDIFVYDRQTSTMRRISVSLAGVQSTQPSRRPAMSANGRFVAFDSGATNFTGTNTNNQVQAYLFDRDSDNDGIFDEPRATSLTLVSVNTAGVASTGACYWPVPSPDGTKVVFFTTSDSLVTGDTNGTMDIITRHLTTSTTTRESVGPAGQQTSAGSYFPGRFSADGRYLSFHSAAQELVTGGHNGSTHIFRRDLQTGQNIIVSRDNDGALADSSSEYSSISADGTYVAYGSAGYNMMEGGVTNPGWVNVYVRTVGIADPFDCNPPVCLADIVNSATFQPPPDGSVDGADLAYLLGAWGPNPGSPADIVDSATFQPPPDGVVDGADLAYLLGSWGSCP